MADDGSMLFEFDGLASTRSVDNQPKLIGLFSASLIQ